MDRLNSFSGLTAGTIARVAQEYGTPVYLYDERFITDRCKALMSMPNAYGVTVRYAMKANSNRSLLRIISAEGLLFDASSMNEVRRAHMAGIDYSGIILTTQEVPEGHSRRELERMMAQGLKYNVCSLLQLTEIGGYAAANNISLAIRVHPGVGSGESATRNTGDNYSCFGIHLSDISKALSYAREKNLIFDHVHVHIGSGASPGAWRDNIDSELDIVGRYFPDAATVSFGGGLKEARMPDERAADITELGDYASRRIIEFYNKTGRRLKMEIEPGTYVMANAGYALTRVVDKKRTGADGLNFIVTNGGLELNARPLFYGSRHPFYVVGKTGVPLTSDGFKAVVVGRCCESGDSQCLGADGVSRPREMPEPGIGDILVIGAVGAYCSSMSPMNYNSHVQVAEVLYTRDGGLRLIRREQTLEQLVANEL